MIANLGKPVPTLRDLPSALRREGALDPELEEGVLIFRVSRTVQNRIETLLRKEKTSKLTRAENDELRQYEDIDDYLRFLNRLSRAGSLNESTGPKGIRFSRSYCPSKPKDRGGP